MNSLPVIWRELLMQSRGRAGHRMRMTTALIALICMAWMMLFSVTQAAPVTQGRALFDALSGVGLVFSLLVGVLSTADAISFEKREGTVGLLFLTDLKGIDVIMGKLVASSLTSFYALLGVLPMLGFGLLLGGVSGGEMWRMSLLLVSCMIFSLSAGLLASTLVTHERAAGVLAFLIVLTLVGGPFLVANLYAVATDTRLVNLEQDFLWPSPIYAASLVRGGPGGVFRDSELRLSLSFMFLLSLLQVLLAGLLLPKVWMELPSTSWTRKVAGRIKAWMRGSVRSRAAYRTRALEQGAYSWMACRDHRKSLYSWLVILLMAGLFIAFRRNSGDIAWEPIATATVLFIGLGVIKLWTISESCNALVDDGRSGALELILVTPLPVSEIARGHWLAWKRIFGRPFLLIFLATTLSIAGALAKADIFESSTNIISLYVVGILVAFADVWAIRWTGMFNALRWKVSNRASGWVVGQILVLPWLLVSWWLVLRSVWSTFIVVGSSDFEWTEILAAWVLASFACDFYFGSASRKKFLSQFRLIAANEPKKAPREVGTRKRLMGIRLRLGLPAALIGSLAIWMSAAHWLNARRLKTAIKETSDAIAPLKLDVIRQWNARGQALYQSDPKDKQSLGPIPPSVNAAVAFDAAAKMLENSPGGGLQTWYYSSMRRGWDMAAKYDSKEFSKLIETRKSALLLLKSAMQAKDMFREAPQSFNRKEWDLWRGNQEVGILIRAAAFHALRQNQAEQACDLMVAHLRFARSHLEVPTFATDGRGRWVLSMALGSLGTLLGEHQFSNAQLDRISAELDALEPRGLMIRRILACMEDSLELARADLDEQASFLGQGVAPSERFALQAALRYWSWSGSRDKSLAAIVRLTPDIIQAWNRSPSDAASRNWSADLDAPGILRRWVFRQDNISECLIYGVIRLANLDSARTALQIERYRLREGRLPSTLEDLPAEFVKEHAKDICTGKNLQYRFQKDNYMVYSLGLDKVDDGGRPGAGPTSYKTGDYLFRVGAMPIPGMDRPVSRR